MASNDISGIFHNPSMWSALQTPIYPPICGIQMVLEANAHNLFDGMSPKLASKISPTWPMTYLKKFLSEISSPEKS